MVRILAHTQCFFPLFGGRFLGVSVLPYMLPALLTLANDGMTDTTVSPESIHGTSIMVVES
jgi:hypothetical protein